MVHSSQHSCCKVAFGRCRLLQALTPGTVELTAGSYYSIAWGKTWNRRHKSRSAFPTGPMRWKKRKMRIFAPSPFLCSWFSGVQKDGTKNLGVFHRCACWSWFKAIPRSYLLPTMNVEQILVGFWDMMFSLCVLCMFYCLSIPGIIIEIRLACRALTTQQLKRIEWPV